VLRYILFDVKLFRDGDRQLNAKALCALLDALTYWNEIYLDEHPETPFLYQTDVRYSLPEPFQKGKPKADRIAGALRSTGLPHDMSQQLADTISSGEHFRDIPTLLENGQGDCDNLACMRAAELRSVDVDASVYLTEHPRKDGGVTYHAIVRYPDGTSEDPSRILGMGGDDLSALESRLEEFRRLAERREKLADKLAEKERAGATVSGGDLDKLRRLAKALKGPPSEAEEIEKFRRLKKTT
jgi:uncharacterized protein YdcH (DUF465 family)